MKSLTNKLPSRAEAYALASGAVSTGYAFAKTAIGTGYAFAGAGVTQIDNLIGLNRILHGLVAARVFEVVSYAYGVLETRQKPEKEDSLKDKALYYAGVPEFNRPDFKKALPLAKAFPVAMQAYFSKNQLYVATTLSAVALDLASIFAPARFSGYLKVGAFAMVVANPIYNFVAEKVVQASEAFSAWRNKKPAPKAETPEQLLEKLHGYTSVSAEGKTIQQKFEDVENVLRKALDKAGELGVLNRNILALAQALGINAFEEVDGQQQKSLTVLLAEIQVKFGKYVLKTDADKDVAKVQQDADKAIAAAIKGKDAEIAQLKAKIAGADKVADAHINGAAAQVVQGQNQDQGQGK